MQTKLKGLFLAFTLVCVPLARGIPVQGRSKTNDDPAKIKASIARRLADKKDKVEIKLRSGEKIKGRITQADDNTFTLTEDKTGKQTNISYSDVARVKGRGMSTGTKIAIIIGVAAVVVIVAGVISVKNADFFRGGIRVP